MRPSLYERLQGLDDQAKAEQILMLPKRSVLASAGYKCLVEILSSDEDALVKFAAALALAQPDPDGSGVYVVPVFLSLLKDAKPLVQAYKPIAIRGYDAIDEIAICLCLVGREQAVAVLPVLLDALNKYTGFNAAMIAHVLLCLALNGRAIAGGITFEQMTQDQQQALLQIATSTRAWRYNMNMAETMDFFGLPTSKEAFQQFCNVQ